jgi:hypothetical protein
VCNSYALLDATPLGACVCVLQHWNHLSAHYRKVRALTKEAAKKSTQTYKHKKAEEEVGWALVNCTSCTIILLMRVCMRSSCAHVDRLPAMAGSSIVKCKFTLHRWLGSVAQRVRRAPDGSARCALVDLQPMCTSTRGVRLGADVEKRY